MEQLFLEVLEGLGLPLTSLPPHVRLYLRYIAGVPRQLQLVFAALALSPDPEAFLRKDLHDGLRLHKEHPDRCGKLR